MGHGKRGKDAGRDAGGFIAIPWSVVDCSAYGRLSAHARALLIEMARQLLPDNNGRLLCSRAYMKTRGWNSTDMLVKARDELLKAGFLHQTVMGHRPNKASWYAVTWRSLEKLPGYDAGTTELFVRSAYRDPLVVVSDPNTGRSTLKPSAKTQTLYRPTVQEAH